MEKTVKVKVTKRYNDRVLKKILKVGTVLTVTEARAERLVKHGVAERISEETAKTEKSAKTVKEEGKE